MDASTNGPLAQSNAKIEWVWYGGTDALLEGEAVCYNTDYATTALPATVATGHRCNRVERPSTSNNMAFAGVAARNYAASSTGQFIEINIPGSRGVKIALGIDTVINTGFLTFTAGSGGEAGRFSHQGYKGRGSAYIRQTVTALLEYSWTGATWSLATDGVTLTVASTTGISAGDTVVLVGGEIESGGASVVPGKYVVSSITSSTVLVLTSTAITGTALAAVYCTGYCYTGNPTCQADLMEGDESGGVQFISLPNAGVVGQAYMVGGISYVCACAVMAADSDVTFAQETYPGAKKAFICLGTIGTSDFTVDLATNGIRLDGSSALAEINAMDAAGESVYLEFNGLRWFTKDATGATEA